MGIRTLGFEKAPRSSAEVDRTHKQKAEEVEEASKVTLKPKRVEKRKSDETKDQSVLPVAKAKPPEVEVTTNAKSKPKPVEPEPEDLKVTVKSEEGTGTEKTVPPVNNTARSPIKIKISTKTSSTPPMARLSGMKTRRKTLRHRKKSIYVQSANKILRSSIRSNKSRQASATVSRQQTEEKPKEKAKETASPPSNRISTRMLIRRSSREGVPEDPLRTVELIKRPVELREPATKLLFLASLGLYPHTGDSDMTPIVVVREVSVSPGKKNGVRKSLELPLIPYHKRLMDLSQQNRDKRSRSPSENTKATIPAAAAGTSKQSANKSCSPPQNPEPKARQKSSSPSPKSENNNARAMSISTIISTSQAINAVSSITVTEVIRKVPAPTNLTSTSIDTKPSPIVSATVTRPSSDLTITPSSKPMSLSSSNNNLNQAPNLSSASKSLLKSNLALVSTRPPPPLKIPLNSKVAQLQHSLPISVSYANANPSTKVEVNNSRSSNLASFLGSEELDRVMQNITIFPATSSRKRGASPSQMDQNIMSIRPVGVDATTCGGNVTISIPSVSMDRKAPPKKRPKMSNATFSMPPLSSSPSISGSQSHNIPVPQQQVTPTEGEALNLSVKRRLEPQQPPAPVSLAALSQSPPKLQYKSEHKPLMNGSKPLNLIIPRPPPLTKAPLEVTNISNYVQNHVPPMVMGGKGNGKVSQAKKPRKLRQQNHNHININQAQLPLPLHHSLPLLPPLPLLTAETAVHAKSLLKCMNGEENACREVGESLDSVKTMLARLQTSIGPAVNGVRLITIE